MSKKYFNYSGAPWQIIETQDPWGKPLTYAVEMDSTHGAMLNTEEYSEGSDWEYVEATSVFIDEWFLKSDPNDLFEEEEDDTFLEDQKRYVDMMTKVHSMSNQRNREELADEYGLTPEDYQQMDEEESRPSGQTLKQMLEGLRSRPDWDDMNSHERLKASLDQSGKNLNRAEDVLGMIRARQSNEMRPTVILNPRKYTDSKTLETALESLRQKDAEAHILVGTTQADDFLAMLKNQETVGLSSVPDLTKPLGLTLDQETLDLIKKLGPKK
jgi:FtsZ-interacting cell division protein YlmF